MGAIADGFNIWLRAWLVDGVPGSGINPPSKSEGRALGALIEAAIGVADSTIAISGSTLTLALDHASVWLELSHATGMTVTIPAHATVAFDVPTTTSGAQAAAGPISFAPAVGVTLHVAANQTAVTAGQGAVWELRQIDTNTWRLYGNLVPA